jgi:hypothetical protein
MAGARASASRPRKCLAPWKNRLIVGEELTAKNDERPDAVNADAFGPASIDGAQMAVLLERVPGACGRIKEGIEDARAGRTIALDEL